MAQLQSHNIKLFSNIFPITEPCPLRHQTADLLQEKWPSSLEALEELALLLPDNLPLMEQLLL